MSYTKTNWEDLPSTNTPITRARLQNMEDGIEEAHNKLNNESIVWTNNNENTSFDSTTITVENLNTYKEIKVVAKNYGTAAYKNVVDVTIPNGYNGYLCIVETNCGLTNRQITIQWENNLISFENAIFKEPTSTSSGTTDNNRCIPLKIIAYK